MKTTQQRFNEKFTVTPGCWPWEAGRDRYGYGRFRLGTQKASAHRVAYEMFVAPLTEGQHVLHRCDNPRCVNPDHLFAGTNFDNVRDMCQKGRQASGPGIFAKRRSYKGESSPVAKLTAHQVASIRQDERVQRVIATEYGVSRATVSHIKTGRIWAN